MSLLRKTFVNLIELNLYCNFSEWMTEEVDVEDENFRSMPFFRALKPFPKLQVFRLLDRDIFLWIDRTPNVLSIMNDWMKEVLCVKGDSCLDPYFP
jgi:hypothetical protein